MALSTAEAMRTGGPTPVSSPSCPLAADQLDDILASALLLGVDGVRLVDTDGSVWIERGTRFGAAMAAHEGWHVIESVANVSLRGATVAVLHIVGSRALGPALDQITLLTAGRLGDAWTAVDELDSLASEIVHNYEELHLLYELGKVLTSQLTVEAAADLVLQKIRHALHASWAELRLVDGGAESWVRRDPPFGLLVTDTMATDRSLTTALQSGGRCLGSLEIGRLATSDPFSSANSKLLDAVGTLAGNAIRNAQLYEELRRQAETLREREAYLRAVLDNVADAIVMMDERGAVVSCNPAAERLFGYTTSEITSQAYTLLLPDTCYHPGSLGLFSPGGSGVNGSDRREATGRRKDGTTFPVDIAMSDMRLGTRRLVIVSVRDMTDRKRFEYALEHQALHDRLTDLPNRALLHDRLDQNLRAAQRDGKSLVLFVMDLDRFKEVNDTFGHHYGDLLLQETGQRLRNALRESDTIARLGGDEFAILLPGATREGAVIAAQKLIEALEEPFLLEGNAIEVAASIGIAVSPDHGSDPHALLRRADVAMYVAKRANSGYAVYAYDQDQHSPNRLALIGELRKAIDQHGLVLHYQPKVDYRTQQVTCVEALVRWQHPRHGQIRPDQFIPLAEQTGLIKPLTTWVLNAALRQCNLWRKSGFRLPVAVNLSMRNVHDEDIVATIQGLLATWEVEPSYLLLEITEGSLMGDPQRAMETLQKLGSLGVQIAIDDFGSGYSSLAYLKRLPVNEMKIDKSFVQQMASNENDAAIVRSTIGLGHDLGLTVVAEGVEDEETWKLLAALGCDIAQGYYVSRPMAALDLGNWLPDAACAVQRIEADAE